MNAIDHLALTLDRAQQDAAPIDPPSATAPIGIAEAYATQHALLARRTDRGERIVGLKLGFTSAAKARQMSVADVILGALTDGMQVVDGGTIDSRACIHPRIEPEVAYLIGEDGRIEAAAPALEIIDSRYRAFRFDLGDVVADDTSAAAYAIGSWMRPESDLSNRAVRLEIDGRLVQTGSTAAILGDPARALAAASRLARTHGFALRAGMILLAGAATVAVPLPRRGVVEATVSGLGRVSIRTDEGGRA